MAWFIIESFVIIVLAFLLGILVGWFWWRRRKVLFGRSAAIAAVSARYEAALAAERVELDRRADDLALKDTEIVRLSELVAGDVVELAERHHAELSARDAEIARLTADVEARHAEIARLSTVIEHAETTAAVLRDDLAIHDQRLADREAEVSRLSASIASIASAAASGRGGAAANVGIQPTAPSAEQIAEFVTPIEHTGGGVPSPAADAEISEAPAADASAPDALAPDGAATTARDELERIDGIGPRIGTALRTAGISTFRQLADADVTTLQSALEGSGLRFAPSLATWSRQASLLAEGDEDGFSTLAAQLAGRVVSRLK